MTFLINKSEKAPVPFTPEEAPPSIITFVFKCFEKKPVDRFKDACSMKEPWLVALDEADKVMQTSQEVSPARRFWKAKWGEKEEVNTTEFRSVFVMEPFLLSPGAVAQLVSQCDPGDFGVVSLDEFQNRCAGKDPQDISKELAVLPVISVTTDPEGIYYTTALFGEVIYTSKGDFFGGKKERVGMIILKNGSVSVRRGGTDKIDYTFHLLKTTLTVIDDTTVDLCCLKPRRFLFTDKADFSKFKEGYEKTKMWLESDE